jgi:hypothetical protein
MREEVADMGGEHNFPGSTDVSAPSYRPLTTPLASTAAEARFSTPSFT